MVGLVRDSAGAPLGERTADHHIRAVQADGSRDVPAEPEPVLHHAVGVVEELHQFHADLTGTGPFLGLSQRGRLSRADRVDAGFAAGR